MKIYDFPFAPNPRKLRVYLGEKGLDVPFETVNLVHGEQRKEPFLTINPLGGLPVLELDDGTRLSESLAIIEYFEELHPDPPMIGTTPLERARTRRLERIADLSVLGRIARYVHNRKSPLPGVRGIPEVAEQMRAELPKPLALFDAELAGQPFVAGARPTIADCTLFAGFQFAQLGEFDPTEGFDHLARWYAEFRERPSTRIPGLEAAG